MEKQCVINVLNDFSADPWGRFRTDNPVSSGEEFRERLLNPAFQNYEKVIVDFTGIEFTPDTSFLGESFIGLVKRNGWSYEDINQKLQLVGSDFLVQLVSRLINNAKNEMSIFY